MNYVKTSSAIAIAALALLLGGCAASISGAV